MLRQRQHRRRRSGDADPALVRLLASAGQAEREGAFARAALVLEEVLRQAPAHEEAARRLAALAPRSARAGAAEALLRTAARKAPGSAAVHASLAEVLHSGGRLDEALACWERAARLAPGDAALHNRRGLACIDAGRFDTAEASFRRAMDLDPLLPGVCLNLARCRRFERDGAEVAGRIEALLERRPAPGLAADLHFALAKIRDDGDEVERAAAHLRAANRLVHRTLRFDAGRHGRAVDALIETFDRELFARHAGGGAQDGRPLFIVGMPRSGTSLVEQILAAHPAVHGAGERRELDRIARRVRHVAGSPESYPRCVRALGPGHAAALGRRYLASGPPLGPGEGRVTDKLPANFLHLGLVALLLPRARVVHCRRDPRDLALSIFSQQFAEGHVWAYAFDDIARFHLAYRRLMAHWRAVLPTPPFELDYEELVHEPEPVCRRLVAFCGLEWDPACLEFHRHRRAVATASNWQVRQPLYRRAVGRWRRYAPCLPELVESLERAGVAPSSAPGEARRGRAPGTAG